MKNVAIILSTLICFTLFSRLAIVPAGEFEGVVIYNIGIDSHEMTPEMQSMFKSSTMTMYVKGERSRTEMTMGPIHNINIVDNKSGIMVSLNDMMGQKTMIKTNLNEDKESSKIVPVIKYINEIKTLAGYKCKKAEVTLTDKENKNHPMTIWYTEELPAYKGNRAELKSLKGFPMEYEIREQPFTMKLSVQSVSKGSVDEAKFIIPEGYKEVKKEDLIKNMNGK